jgi:hypothetical protein
MLNMFSEITPVYTENYAKHINKNADLLTVYVGGTYM